MAIRLLFWLVSAVCLTHCMGQNQKIERDADDNYKAAKIANSDDFLDILSSKAERSMEKRGIETEGNQMEGSNVEKDTLKKRLALEKRWFGSSFRVLLPQISVPPVFRHIVRQVSKAAGKVVTDVVKEVGGAAKHVLKDVGKLGEAAGKVVGELGKPTGVVVEGVLEAAKDVADDVEELVEAADDVVQDLGEAAFVVAVDAIEAYAECATDIIMNKKDDDIKETCRLRKTDNKQENEMDANVIKTDGIASTEAEDTSEKRNVGGLNEGNPEGTDFQMTPGYDSDGLVTTKRRALKRRFITGIFEYMALAAAAEVGRQAVKAVGK